VTHTQTKLLAYIQDRLLTGDVSPSYEEMADHMWIKSKTQVQPLILALADAGHIRHKVGRARSITMPDQAAEVMPDIRATLESIVNTTSLDYAQKAAARALAQIERVTP
jgi:SOS-response transcriptional repressor LexA